MWRSQGRFPPEWNCYAIQSPLRVCNTGDGSEVEDCSWTEGDHALESDCHGVNADQCRTPYLARQLSVFVTQPHTTGLPL
jgi:hypothetical protein